ncbi:MAG: response regulator [Opitutaceae bacterium]|nr:response regulator [Opitutaceae bacterium]
MSPPPVLYAEDDENDVFLLERAFARAQVENPLRAVTDGAAAQRYLAGTDEFADRHRFPAPCLALLDLNLPRKSGLEVLQWVRTTPALRSLPVILLTSSSQSRDIRAAYAYGANGYLVKPASAEKLVELVAALRDTCLIPAAPIRGWLELKGNQRPPAAV